ncbi:MAG: hypothetical protein F4045_12245 [Chloroflexi bacterium]|nr:hypothetical protein [Chloroflexota bacterium]MYK35834.1 hypothetical protein [Chloroflexota bacterium]
MDVTRWMFPTEEEEIAEVLSLARRIVSTGWDSGWASDKDGNQVEEWQDEAVNFNLLAAFLKVDDVIDGRIDYVVQSKATEQVFDIIRNEMGSEELNVYDWQTDPNRTKEDVLGVLDKALQNMKVDSNGHQP